MKSFSGISYAAPSSGKFMETIEELDGEQVSLLAEPLLINLGPAHPATHGTVRIVIELDGERIVRSDVQVG